MARETIGRYQVRSELGRGGMATVYVAYDPLFEREVAIKVLPSYFLHETDFRRRFEREAKTLAGLEHPSIVAVYDYGEDQSPYLVMRLMRGGTLKHRLEAEGLVSPSKAAEILGGIADALDAAHAQHPSIIHRDLKPDNILFDELGKAYLSDFGIVKLAESTQSFTKTGGILGTPAYMSPEQARGERLDGRSDNYTLGVILYEMLTGKTPYSADTPVGLIMMHATEPVPDILADNPRLPSGCQAVIQQAMAKDKEQRFPTATAMIAALHGVSQATVLESPALSATGPILVAGSQQVTTVESPQVTQQQQRPSLVAPPPPTAPAPTAATDPPSRSPNLWLIALAAVVIVLVGIGIILLIDNQLKAGNEVAEPPAQAPLATVDGEQTAAAAVAETATAEAARVTAEAEAAEATAAASVALAATATAEAEAGAIAATASAVPTPTETPTPGPTRVGGGSGLIAFDSDRAAADNREIFTIDVETGELTRLTQGIAPNGDPSWSPDGTRLSFESRRDAGPDFPEIYIMNEDGGGQVRLTNNLAIDWAQDWSPDGEKIAFASDRDGGMLEIYVMNADGTSPVRLTENDIVDSFPSWSPDSSQIVFESVVATGVRDLFIMNADGSGLIRLTDNGTVDQYPAWSPDGGRIAFTSRRDGGDREIYVMNVDGSDPVRLTNSPGWDAKPKWSPDGTMIVFESQRDGNTEIYVMNVDGGGQVNLTNDPADDTFPSWQPTVNR